MKKIFSAMNEKLSQILWVDAQEIAQKTQHKLVEPIDILIALMQDPHSQGTAQLARFFPQGVTGVIKMAGTLLRETAVTSQKKEKSPKKSKLDKNALELEKLVEEFFPVSEEEMGSYLYLSRRSKNLLEKAFSDALKKGDSYLGTYHVFMACVYNKELYEKLSSKIFLNEWREHLSDIPLEKKTKEDEDAEDEGKGSLSQFVTNLSALAKAGELEPMIGRERDLGTLISYLGRKKKK